MTITYNLKNITRLHGLDHLRGLLSLVVMLYHFSLWLSVNDSLPVVISQPLNLLGVYAVSTFFALSGVALFVVYRDREIGGGFLKEFTIKRVFRIGPLFWLVTAIYVIFNTGDSSIWKSILNFTLLFSWVAPDAYLAVGAWSIGNEIAFYTLFPSLIIFWRKKWGKSMILVTVAYLTWFYGFHLIDPTVSLQEQWKVYISPFNQLILFVGGLWIGSLLVSKRLETRTIFSLFIGSTIAFLIVAYRFPLSECIYGPLRLILVTVCLTWCLCFGINRDAKKWPDFLLGWLGALSYSIYLLPPIVYKISDVAVAKMAGPLIGVPVSGVSRAILVASIAIPLTIASAYRTFRWVEKPGIRLGQRLLLQLSR